MTRSTDLSFSMVVIGHLGHTQERGAMADNHPALDFVIGTIIVAIAGAIPVAMVYLGMFMLD